MRHPDVQHSSIVVDATYLCNASCRYCQWGSPTTPGRIHRPLKEILIPAATLSNLGTKRVVISGGEPRLHPELEQILSYYANLVDEVVIITNGYGLTPSVISGLLGAGATGVTVSLDSVDPMEAFLTRATTPQTHNEILSNLRAISSMPRNFDFGINSVVSHITANWMTVSGMLEFGKQLGVESVKFQPIFDDGYASKHAPDLLLTSEDVDSLLDVAHRLETIEHPVTNPAEFWVDVATLAGGNLLPPHNCGLGPLQSISVRGNLGICFWVNSSSYGSSSSVITKSDSQRVQKIFEGEKQKCKVGFHCFCTQEIGHKWSTQKPKKY